MKTTTIALICLMLVTACLSGCAGNDEAFTQKNYTADGTQITEVNMDVQDRQIEVLRSTDDQIHIDYFENSKEFYDISVSEDRALTMTAVTNKSWTDYVGVKSAGSRKISLQLPDALLKTLNLSTTNEDISLSALAISGDLTLSSEGGDIVFDQLNVGNAIQLKAKNGNISGEILGSYDDYAISCEIKKGESNLPASKENGTKKLTVSNNNGDIGIAFVGE